MNNGPGLILKALQNSKTEYMPGSALGSMLGTSRAAVWKHILTLRKKGYIIEGKKRHGYRLIEEPDRLNAGILKTANINHFTAVESTNKIARSAAANSSSFFSAYSAEEQLHGRGRLSRNWFSPSGAGLWFSALIHPDAMNPAEAAPVTLTTAAVLAAYLNSEYGLPVKIKWPNDLMINGKKFGGILTEMISDLDRVSSLIVGIGLNINNRAEDFPEELRGLATSAYIESGARIDRTELLLNLTAKLESAYRVFCESGFFPFYEQWKKYNYTLGRHIKVKLSGTIVQGTAVDLDKDGSLLLEEGKGTIRKISYGEIV